MIFLPVFPIMPFSINSGAGVIFGVTGGVMEAALRHVADKNNEALRELQYSATVLLFAALIIWRKKHLSLYIPMQSDMCWQEKRNIHLEKRSPVDREKLQ